MEIKYTEQEKMALREKINNPHKEVTCPRCGSRLIYRESGNSCEVTCPTKGCIHGSIRGI